MKKKLLAVVCLTALLIALLGAYAGSAAAIETDPCKVCNGIVPRLLDKAGAGEVSDAVCNAT